VQCHFDALLDKRARPRSFAASAAFDLASRRSADVDEGSVVDVDEGSVVDAHVNGVYMDLA
jgi:hypothetical protein